MSRRVSIVVILAAVLLGALAIDSRVDDESTATVDDSVDRTEFAIATPPDGLAATWFCAGGTANLDEPFANHIVDIVNPTDAAMDVTLTVFGGNIAAPSDQVDPESHDDDPTDDDTGDETDGDEDTGDEADGDDSGDGADGAGETDGESGTNTGDGGGTVGGDVPTPVTERFTLEAQSRRQAPLSDFVTAPVASALVEGPGGLVVEHEVVSVHGRDAKPCATSASDTWHFAWGDTSVDARELLVLFNPYPDDAIVEGVFSTDDGTREPQRFEALVVPARGVVGIDLGDDVTRRDEVAATIRTRTGRVVVDRVLRLNGDDGNRRGLTVQTGVAAPQLTWIYADGLVSETVDETIALYNPGDEVAEVEIVPALDDPETNGVPESIAVSLPPGSHEYVDLGADDLLPAGVPHRITVLSANGVPFVSERVLFAAGDTRQGISVSTGSPVEASQWFFAAGAANDTSDEWLVVANLDPQVLTSISVLAIGGGQVTPVSELQGVELAPGERRAFRLGEHITRDDLAIIVTATEPVVVERGLYRVGDGRGISNAVGIPGPVGLRLPADALSVEVDADLGDVDIPTTTVDPNAPPPAPDDVELPEPDDTLLIPDDEGDDGG